MPFVFSELHLIHFIDQFKTKEGQETLARNVLVFLGSGTPLVANGLAHGLGDVIKMTTVQKTKTYCTQDITEITTQNIHHLNGD